MKKIDTRPLLLSDFALWAWLILACMAPDLLYAQWSAQPGRISMHNNPTTTQLESQRNIDGVPEWSGRHQLMGYSFRIRAQNLKIASQLPAPAAHWAVNMNVRLPQSLAERPLLETFRRIDHPEADLALRRGRLTIYYQLTDEGLRQNFQLDAPMDPYGGATTESIEISLEGLTAHNDREPNTIALAPSKGEKPVLYYQDLQVWDARGKPLQAHMRGQGDHLVIQVHSQSANYPITIDPVFKSAQTFQTLTLYKNNLEGLQNLSKAGDVNGDGIDDLLIGGTPLPAHPGPNVTFIDGAKIYPGGCRNGLSSTPVWQVRPQPAPNGHGSNNRTYFANQPVQGSQFGWSASYAGDVNGDGSNDLLIGAPDEDTRLVKGGSVYLYYGSGHGTDTVADWKARQGMQPASRFGEEIAGGGDVNGDGFDDFVVAATGYRSSGHTPSGKIFLFLGGRRGPRSSPAWSYVPAQTNSDFGFKLDLQGDVNNDGYADLLVAAPTYDDSSSSHPTTRAGKIMLFLGDSTGFGKQPDWTFTGTRFGQLLGQDLAHIGDINGDGYGDVAASAGGSGNGMIFHGNRHGLSSHPVSSLPSARSQGFNTLGVVGDVDNDGYDDLLVGTPRYYTRSGYGQIDLFKGSMRGLKSSSSWKFNNDSLNPNNPNVRPRLLDIGATIADRIDINGDGMFDVVTNARGTTITNNLTLLHFSSDNGSMEVRDRTYYLSDNTCSIQLNAANILKNPCLPDSIAQLKIQPDRFTYADTGRNPVLVEGFNQRNQRVFRRNITLTIRDTSAPNRPDFNPFRDTVYLDEQGRAQIQVRRLRSRLQPILNRSFCDLDSFYLQQKPTYSCTDVGVDSLKLVLRDRSGNQGNALVLLSVIDSTMPKLHLPRDTTICASDSGALRVRYDSIWASDNCPVMMQQMQGGGPGDPFQPGGNQNIFMARDSSGHTIFDTLNIHIQPPPSTRFATNSTGDTIAFAGIDTLSNYFWKFGDGNADTGQVVYHEYASFGNYTLIVTAEDSIGCRATDSTLITVSESGVATGIPDLTDARIQMHPNPFQQRLTVDLQWPMSADARVMVFDLQGRRVATLWDGLAQAGKQQLIWEPAPGVARGQVYLIHWRQQNRSGQVKVLYRSE